MSQHPTVLLVAGARPNFMKIAPIVKAMREDNRLEALLIHTGQHYDHKMSKLFFDQLGMPRPDVDLSVGSASHARQTAEIMGRFEPVLVERSPAAIVVVGDVNSTIACALVAVKLGVPVAHVEAGLRSFDRGMPEEINRVLTDAISSWLFVSEQSGVDNLLAEGAKQESIHFTGNVMIDTLMRFRATADALDVPAAMGLGNDDYALLTLHRPSNVDEIERLNAMLEPIRELGSTMPVLFPVHPRTRKVLGQTGLGDDDGVRLLEPLGYLEFLSLMSNARLVLTDSGGIQEETTVLGVPCLTLRENTERPVTVSTGTNRVVGTNPSNIRDAIHESMKHRKGGTVPELWDGKAAERIVKVLAASLSG